MASRVFALARASSSSSFARPAASRSSASSLIPRRSMAGGGDNHEPPRINIWDDPMSPSKWKEEHFVLASLSFWGLIIYGGFKAFGGGKKEKKEEVAPAAKH